MSSNQTSDVGLTPGTKVGKYKILERLAIGGQAIIYKAHDPMLDRFVAIKQISTHLAEDPKFLERFQREAQILARLGAEQSAVVNVLDLIQDEHGLFMVMEFVAGHTLEQSLQDNPGPVETKAVLAILWRLTAGLHAVHQAGIIHRDLKPGNIIVGAGLKCKIMDFGVAATKDGQTSMVMGTTKYMAPELYEGKDVDARADMYSLGFITYEMLLGRTRFNELFDDVVRDKHSEHLRWMKWHGNESLTAPPLSELRPEVPKALSDMVARMMAKKPDDRYASMEELGRLIKTTFSPKPAAGGEPRHHKKRSKETSAPQKLTAFTDEEPSLDYQPPATAPLPKKQISFKTKLIIAGAISALLVAGLATALILSRSNEEQRNRQTAAIFTSLQKQYDDQQFAKAAAGLADFIKKYPRSPDAPKASVYWHLALGKSAVEEAEATKDDKAKPDLWKTAAEESDRAYQAFREAQGKAAVLPEDMEVNVKAFQSSRAVRQQFQEVMDAAAKSLASNSFDEARKTLVSAPETGIPSHVEKRRALQVDIDAKECEFKYRTGVRQAREALAKSDFALANEELARTASMLKKDEKFSQLPPSRLDEMNKEVAALQAKLASTSEFSKNMVEAEQAINEAQGLKATDPAKAIQRKRDGLESLQAANKLQPSAELAQRIKTLDAEIACDEGLKLLADRNFAGGRDAFKKSLAIMETPQAKEGLAKCEERLTVEPLRKEAETAFDAREWQKALDKYTQALQASGEGPDAKEIETSIKECKFNLKIEDARKLATEHKFPEAASALEDARRLMPERKTEVDNEMATITRQRDYEKLLTVAAELLKQRDYTKARDELQKARKIQPGQPVEDLLNQVNYEQFKEMGRAAFEQTRYNEARAYFKQAQGVKDTTEIQTLIKQAEDKANQK